MYMGRLFVFSNFGPKWSRLLNVKYASGLGVSNYYLLILNNRPLFNVDVVGNITIAIVYGMHSPFRNPPVFLYHGLTSCCVST